MSRRQPCHHLAQARAGAQFGQCQRRVFHVASQNGHSNQQLLDSSQGVLATPS